MDNAKRLMRIPEVSHQLGICRATIYKYIEDGLFPKPVCVGKKCVAWPAYEIDQMNDAYISGHNSKDELHSLADRITARRNDLKLN